MPGGRVYGTGLLSAAVRRSFGVKAQRCTAFKAQYTEPMFPPSRAFKGTFCFGERGFVSWESGRRLHVNKMWVNDLKPK